MMENEVVRSKRESEVCRRGGEAATLYGGCGDGEK